MSADPEQPDLVGALVEEVGDTVVITYTRGDGTNWKITYRIDERYEYE